jgi:phage protein D/phage baseplate assembly protein gpV
MPHELFSDVYIKIKGRAVNEKTMDKLESVIVDLSLVLPNMFDIHLRDEGFDLLDSRTFNVGDEVEISAKEAEATRPTTLMKGEITAIEPEFIAGGMTTFHVIGYDKIHRLYRKKQTKTYLQVTDSQLAQKIAQDCSLKCTVDNTNPQYEYIFQDNQTNMEFLQDRAQRVGYYAYARDGQLYFVKQPKNGRVELEWGKDLIDFQARLTTAEQVSEVNVHGWDPSTKSAILGKKNVPVGVAMPDGKRGGDVAKTAFGKSEDYVTDQPVWTVDEANNLAQSVLNKLAHTFFTAEGTCEGNPKIQAGTEITIKGIGKRFSGKYLISHAEHRYDDSGYKTHFEISGNHANTIGYLLASKDGSRQHSNGRGVVVGVVTNLNDPDGLARIKVKYPSMPKSDGNEIESAWARLVTPMAGAERGIEFLPEVNDEVLVAFENGDSNHPYILGALWNKTDKPPEPTANVVKDGKVQKRIIKSASGHIITIDDTQGAEQISIIDKTGKNSIKIDSKNNAIGINSEADITIEGKANLTLKGKTILIEATQGGNMDLKANNVNLNAQAKATLKGTGGVDVDGGPQVNVKSTGTTKIGGMTTSINGDTMTEVKGAIVKIN